MLINSDEIQQVILKTFGKNCIPNEIAIYYNVKMSFIRICIGLCNYKDKESYCFHLLVHSPNVCEVQGGKA